MAIELTIILNNSSGCVLDRTKLSFDYKYPAAASAHNEMQDRIHAVITAWTLHPGDTIEILGNEEAFDNL